MLDAITFGALRRRETLRSVFAHVQISGPGKDLHLHIGDDRTLHQSTRCSLYKPVWTGDGRVYHRVLSACSQVLLEPSCSQELSSDVGYVDQLSSDVGYVDMEVNAFRFQFQL